ncbi:MAG: MobA/MobL protein [Nitrospirae bacterium]|nr:MAG: MobA/MobL protein [Nitrospirota bacterium]
MAHYHCHVSSLGPDKSAAKTAAYICRVAGYAHRDEHAVETYAFNIPSFAKNATDFFAKSDMHERVNACRGKHFNIALPNGYDHASIAAEIVRPFVLMGLPILAAVHDKPGNKHLHILVSERMQDDYTRSLDADQFFKRASQKKDGTRTGGARKTRDLSNNRDWLMAFRRHVAESINFYVAEADKVDHRSHLARGLDRLPERHRGPAGHQNQTRHKSTWHVPSACKMSMLSCLG